MSHTRPSNDDRVAADAHRARTDTSLDTLRSPGRRRLAALACLALILVVLLVGYIGTDASRIGWALEARHVHAMFWLVLLLSLALPSLLLAWSEREV